MLRIMLLVLTILSLSACTVGQTPINIGKPMASYSKQAPAIGYLYKRFIEIDQREAIFSDQEASDMLEAMDMVRMLVNEMNADSIGGTLDSEAFAFYAGKITEKWKLLRSILDRHSGAYPEDVSIIYSKTRAELDLALAACNTLLSESQKEDIDWLKLEEYGKKLVDAIGPYINIGGLI